MDEIYAICCTYNRHSLLERAVSLFLQQDYKGPHKLLIYNNSTIDQNLDREYDNIVLINNNISYTTGKPYDNVGDIFKDALSHVPFDDARVITFWDDDDIFLPNHLSEGMKGYIEALEMGKRAYKPLNTYFRYANEPQKLSQNLCEPSIFVNTDFVRKHGFISHSAAYHHGWINPLIKEDLLYTKRDREPTFIYDWSTEASAFKISGDGENPENFSRHKQHSGDIGDQIITPYNYII